MRTWAWMVGSSEMELTWLSVCLGWLRPVTPSLWYLSTYVYGPHTKLWEWQAKYHKSHFALTGFGAGWLRCDRPLCGASNHSDRSFIVECGYAKGWGHDSTLILGQGYGRWALRLVWEKLYPPTGFFIYCNSRAPWLRSKLLYFDFGCRVTDWSSWKIGLAHMTIIFTLCNLIGVLLIG